MDSPERFRIALCSAAISVGDGRLLYVAGSDCTSLVLAAELPASAAITDSAGNAVPAGELPYAAAREGKAYPARELCVRTEDGQLVRVISEVTPAYAPDGTPAGVCLLSLAPADATSTAERFVTIATHELRSPIASLQLDLERLRRRLMQTENVRGSDVAKDMERASRQVTRLTLLIQNLLDVRRMQAHQFTLASDVEAGDLALIVREMVETLRPQAAALGCDIALVTAEPISGLWDQLRIEQVLHNLVTNALKYARSGKRIEVRLTRDAASSCARLSVRDHGPGVPLADRQRIFEPYERGECGDAAAAHSLGLGLYIVREIVSAHGGTVRVEPADGGGASFIIDLPIRQTHCPETT